MNLPIREWLNLEKKKRIKKIKVKKCMGVGCVAECVEESSERRKRKKTKGEGLALVAEEKKKKRQREMGWVGCGGKVPINILKE